MRATFIALTALCLACFFPAPSRAQGLPEMGSPEAAFAGGPLRLSKSAAAMLRSHYQGDKVPLIPQPFRGRLDAALATRDWPRVEAAKKELIAARGLVMALAWEQTRFIATGGVGLAEMHARDIAATNSSGVAETAAMLWFYAAAATLTDGHKCADPEAKTTHLASLRGAAYEPVLRILRGLDDGRVTAMRDLAIRLESVLAADRNDDTMCRTGAGKPEIRPDLDWRPDASKSRLVLARNLTALAAITRSKPVEAAKPSTATAKPAAVRQPNTPTPPAAAGSPGITVPTYASPFPSPSLAPSLEPPSPPADTAAPMPSTAAVAPAEPVAPKRAPIPDPPIAQMGKRPATPDSQ